MPSFWPPLPLFYTFVSDVTLLFPPFPNTSPIPENLLQFTLVSLSLISIDSTINYFEKKYDHSNHELSKYIHVFENVVSDKLCDQIIKEYCNDSGFCSGCNAKPGSTEKLSKSYGIRNLQKRRSEIRQ